MDRGVIVFLDQLFGYQNGVLKVIASPRHERNKHVSAECKLAAVGTRAVSDDLALSDLFAGLDDRSLVDTGVLVGTLEFDQRIDIRRNLTRDSSVDLVVGLHDNAFGIDIIHDAVTLGDDNRTRIACGDLFHTGADIRRLGTKKRHRLTLHVRTHQGAVGVVVLKERDQRGGHRDKLFRRNVHVLDVSTVGRDELTLLPCSIALLYQVSLFVQLNIGLPDNVPILFPCGQIERVRFELSLLSAVLGNLAVGFLDVFERYVLVRLELRSPAVMNLDVLDHTAFFDLAVRRLDKAELVNAGKARQ